jgi:dipeptidyl aminopeptidase/acylaminoacyl peptidase
MPYGTWKSTITSDRVVAETIRLSEIWLEGDDLYWLEMRPAEGGRHVIVRWSRDTGAADVTPPGFNVRTRVHEYGGGAFTVDGGTLYFAHWQDQRLYRQDPGQEPRPITPAGQQRYADGVVDRRRGRLICVVEDHATPAGEPGQPTNSLIAVDLEGRRPAQPLVAGHDFYASPRLSPDGARLAWLAWNHPHMPWDETELWVAELDAAGELAGAERLCGGAGESIFQPEWSPDGHLYFVSDRSGWWNLYRWDAGRPPQAPPGGQGPLAEREAEFGLPQWVFRLSTYAFVSAERLVCAYAQQGTWYLAHLDLVTGQLTPIETPYTQITQVRAAAGRVLFLGGSPTEPQSVVQLDLATGRHEVLRRSSAVDVDPGFLSRPEAIEFPTSHGHTAFAFFYPPTHPEASAPPGERPPLLVLSHGGPTGATSNTLNLALQYWTSRGFAVLNVNYGGSTGYGRAYRQRLEGRWGLVDVDDCVHGARYLVSRGDVDGERLIIRGGSAGGYTTLCALTFRDLFSAGASYYGVSDLEALARDTHKFESRYLDRLVGPYPERQDLYRARSPLYHAGRLSAPTIFFQGLEDPVVPPNQAEAMVAALRDKGVPVAYLPFAGEQHGFRQAAHLKRALEAELYFYSRVFAFDLADPVEPVPIENLR